jgi:putative chitinase
MPFDDNARFRCGNISIGLSTVVKMCPGSPVKNIQENMPILLRELEKRKLGFESMIRMTIATVYVETGRFAPLSEFKSRFNTSAHGHPFDLYDNRSDLGNKGPPDGEKFKGRGFIQLTGRANYTKYGQILGIDLLANPELANNTAVAAGVLSEFLKTNEARIVAALNAGDLTKARKIINGGSHGLDTFSTSYNAGVPIKAAA